MTGTEDDIASFVAARWQGLVRFGFMLTGDRAAGEDLVQEALLRCLPSWGRLDPQGVEALRTQGDGPTRLEGAPASPQDVVVADQAEPITADIADASSEQSDLRQALSGLPRQQRVVLVLRYWQDLSEAEIAELLGVSARHGEEPGQPGLRPAARGAGLVRRRIDDQQHSHCQRRRSMNDPADHERHCCGNDWTGSRTVSRPAAARTAPSSTGGACGAGAGALPPPPLWPRPRPQSSSWAARPGCPERTTTARRASGRPSLRSRRRATPMPGAAGAGERRRPGRTYRGPDGGGVPGRGGAPLHGRLAQLPGAPAPCTVELRADSGPWFEGDAVKIANARAFDYSPFDARTRTGAASSRRPVSRTPSAPSRSPFRRPMTRPASVRPAASTSAGTSPTGRSSSPTAPRSRLAALLRRPTATCRGACSTAGTWTTAVPSTTTSVFADPRAGFVPFVEITAPEKFQDEAEAFGDYQRPAVACCWGASARARASGRPTASVRASWPAPSRSRGSWSPT